jgi:hypothetical protein
VLPVGCLLGLTVTRSIHHQRKGVDYCMAIKTAEAKNSRAAALLSSS